MAKILAESAARQDILDAIEHASNGDTIVIPPGQTEFADKFMTLKFEKKDRRPYVYPLEIKSVTSDKEKKVLVLAWDDYPTPVDHFTVYYGKKSIAGGAPAEKIVIVPYNKSCIAISDDDFYEEDRTTYFVTTVSLAGGIQSGYSEEVRFVSPNQSEPLPLNSYKGRVGYCLPEHFMSREVKGMRMLAVECVADNVCKHCGR